MSVISYFKNQGGLKLIKQYARNHVLLYAVRSFLLVPKNRVGLEIFRELVNAKTYLKLKKKYRNVLESVTEVPDCGNNSPISNGVKSEKPKIIWVCWLQGIENAPPLVQACYKSIKECNPEYEVRLLTSENLQLYTNLPDFIIEKWQKGIITNTHFSDILRNNLLLNHGGTWVDATLFFTSHIPSEIENAQLFYFQTLKPGRDGKTSPLSNWFISSTKNNPVLNLQQKLLFSYWKRENRIWDYFFFHYFFKMSLEKYSEIAESVPKYTNETPHIMLFELGKKYDENKFNLIAAKSFCHKLTYKVSDEVKNDKDSLYSFIGQLI